MKKSRHKQKELLTKYFINIIIIKEVEYVLQS